MRKMGMMRNRMTFLLAAGTMTMTSAAGLAGCTSAPASVTVQSAENTGITVTSQEKIKAEPDIAEITYSVYSQAADASTCQSENQTDLDAVLALLKEKGIADTSVQTSGLGLNPIYDWDNGKKITGYEMTTEVVVSDVAIEDAGAIISDSVNAGINSIDSVQYQCSNFDEIYQEALKKAIESARVKAEAMAEAGGCKLGTMTNVQEYSSGQQARYYDTSYSSGMAMEEVDALGGLSLNLFLAMAMMSLKLWQLAALALPMIVILLVQTVVMFLYANFLVFNIMGRDYEAAAMTTAFCGFGMGATPNAMANMRALVERYGPAPRAFFIVPLVGSLFVDFFNSMVLTTFMNLL